MRCTFGVCCALASSIIHICMVHDLWTMKIHWHTLRPSTCNSQQESEAAKWRGQRAHEMGAGAGPDSSHIWTAIILRLIFIFILLHVAGAATLLLYDYYCVCNKTYNKTKKMQTKYEWVRWFSPFVFVLFALRCCGLHTERPQGVGCSAKCGHLSDLRFGVIDNEMKTTVSVIFYTILLHSVHSIMMRTFISSFFMYGHYNAMTAAIKAAKSTVKCLGRLMTGCQRYKKNQQITLLWFCLRKKERKEKKMKLFLAMPYDKTRFWGEGARVKEKKTCPIIESIHF